MLLLHVPYLQQVELAVQLDEHMQPGMAAVSIDLTARDVQVSCMPWDYMDGDKSFIQAGSRYY